MSKDLYKLMEKIVNAQMKVMSVTPNIYSDYSKLAGGSNVMHEDLCLISHDKETLGKPVWMLDKRPTKVFDILPVVCVGMLACNAVKTEHNEWDVIGLDNSPAVSLLGNYSFDILKEASHSLLVDLLDKYRYMFNTFDLHGCFQNKAVRSAVILYMLLYYVDKQKFAEQLFHEINEMNTRLYLSDDGLVPTMYTKFGEDSKFKLSDAVAFTTRYMGYIGICLTVEKHGPDVFDEKVANSVGTGALFAAMLDTLGDDYFARCLLGKDTEDTPDLEETADCLRDKGVFPVLKAPVKFNEYMAIEMAALDKLLGIRLDAYKWQYSNLSTSIYSMNDFYEVVGRVLLYNTMVRDPLSEPKEQMARLEKRNENLKESLRDSNERLKTLQDQGSTLRTCTDENAKLKAKIEELEHAAELQRQAYSELKSNHDDLLSIEQDNDEIQLALDELKESISIEEMLDLINSVHWLFVGGHYSQLSKLIDAGFTNCQVIDSKDIDGSRSVPSADMFAVSTIFNKHGNYYFVKAHYSDLRNRICYIGGTNVDRIIKTCYITLKRYLEDSDNE